MKSNNQNLSKAEQLYEQYGKPLEVEHRGQYLAVSPQGKTLLGNSLLGIMKEAAEKFGPGNFIFKVGEKTVGKWRQLEG